jgi:hypothetical protein
MLMLQILGMFLAAAEPATAVWVACKKAKRVVHTVDTKILPRVVPPELLEDDDDGYYLHQLEFNPIDQKALGLPKTTYTVLLSDEELGAYVRCEGVVLCGFEQKEIPGAKRELLSILQEGEKKSTTMSRLAAAQ